MIFQEEVKIALTTYKEETLGIHDVGIFRYRGDDLPREHILPTNLRDLNIIRYYRKAFFSSTNSEIHFHRYFHHLNSSQALCINLFYPLIAEGRLDLVTGILGLPKTPIAESCFEKESDIETGAGRKTNFDYFMQLNERERIFFEIKYTETKFGGANSDDEHRKKFRTTYQPLLENNRFIKPEHCEMDAFFSSYQILRNLSHIDENSLVVFVYPKANTKIHIQAQSVREHMLTDKGNEKFKILLLEPTIDKILDQIQTPNLRGHYLEFRDKYLNHGAI